MEFWRMKMKDRKWILIIFCALFAAAAFIVGVTGVIDLTKHTGQDSVEGSDRLIGALITPEYLDLFDMDSYIADHVSQITNNKVIDEGEAQKYQGRLYASFIPDKDHPGICDIVFEEVDGICVFCAYLTADPDEPGAWTSSGDEGYTAASMNITDADHLERMAMEGTVYSSTKTGWKRFYVNPMYQTAAGDIYAVPGDGNSFGGEVVSGMSCSQTLSENQTNTVNGETKTIETEIKLNFTFMDPCVSVSVLQFDSENQMVAQEKFSADCLPTEFVPQKSAQYIILEKVCVSPNGSQTNERELVQLDDEYASAFSVRDDGICVKHEIAIKWKR